MSNRDLIILHQEHSTPGRIGRLLAERGFLLHFSRPRCGDAFRNEAFQYGRAAFGFQFHSELTHHMMCRWTTRGHARLALPNARPRVEHFDGRLVHDAKTRLWLEKFIDLWSGLAKRESGGT